MGIGVAAGIIAIYAALAKVGIFAALLLGIAMGVFMALVVMQIFCTGENADLGQMEEMPEGSAAAGASGGGTPSGPPKVNAPKDRGTPAPKAPAPNPPKPNPPAGHAPEPVLPNKADPLNARTAMGTSAAAAGTDKVSMRAETHSGGNDAATAQDPTFTSASTDAEAGAQVAPAAKVEPKPKKKAKTKAKKTGAKATPADTADENVGTKPDVLSGPRGGEADNLKEIKGVGPKLEGVLHDMGFYHFDQIANWTDEEVAWVDANLVGFKGRVSRDNWIDQAKTLAAGGDTEFSKRVDKGDVY
jgi:predicted flap endonuclease-1-like 5' DNA nuclease